MINKKIHILRTIIYAFMAFTLLAGCSTGYKQESTGQYVDGSVITAKVKTALLEDKDIRSLPITVKTYKNTVQLSGFVNSPAQKYRAEQIAKQVAGVNAVENALVVKSR